jgi:hypothetical protein
MRRVEPSYSSANAAHALHRQGEIDLDVLGLLCAVNLRVTHVGVKARRSNQRLRRNATIVQRDSAEQVLFDECNTGAESSR